MTSSVSAHFARSPTLAFTNNISRTRPDLPVGLFVVELKIRFVSRTNWKIFLWFLRILGRFFTASDLPIKVC